MDVSQAFARQASRARLVVWLLGTSAAVALAGILAAIVQYALLERALGEAITQEAADANDAVYGGVAALRLLVLVASAIAWFRWAYRAQANLALMGTGRSDHTPVAAVVSWFIPFLNLVRPYQITRELWLRSRDGNARADVSGLGSPPLLSLWWTAWIVSSILGQLVFRLTPETGDIAALQSFTILGGVSDGADAAGAVLALVVVRRIDAWQRSASVTARALAALG